MSRLLQDVDVYLGNDLRWEHVELAHDTAHKTLTVRLHTDDGGVSKPLILADVSLVVDHANGASFNGTIQSGEDFTVGDTLRLTWRGNTARCKPCGQ